VARSLTMGPHVSLATGRLGSKAQALAALGAPGVDDGAATAGLHANQEAVGAGAADFGGLVGAFHGA